MAACTSTECANPTEQVICGQCVSDLQQWISQIPSYIEELPAAIYKLDNVTPQASEGGNGTKSAGSKAPINLDAYQIRENLLTVNPDANTYANDQYAAGIAETIIQWVRNAELIISGPESDEPEAWTIAQAREKLKGHFPEPMTPRECAKWLRENAGIKISPGKINDWYRRGKIRKHPGSTPKKPLYAPKEVLTAHLTRQHE